MKYFGEFLRYSIPYTWRLATSVVFNLLGTLFNLMLFGMAIPFLGILFDNQNMVYEKVPFEFSKDAITNNFNYFLSQIIASEGPQKARLVVSLIVVISVLFKSTFI
jgi:subfamily B ATP-binding cassette protein MsbA